MNFNVTPERIKKISKCLDRNTKEVENIFDKFTKLFKEDGIGTLNNQYLAHLIRAMEALLREHHDNPLFTINITPLKKDDLYMDVGTANYYMNRSFNVFYHPELEVKQLRILLAHELGHLFLASLFNTELNTALTRV